MNKQVTLLLTDTVSNIGMAVTEDEAARSKAEWLDSESSYVTLNGANNESIQIAVDYVVGFVIHDFQPMPAQGQVPANPQGQITQAG